jgi:CRISPR-associated protein Cas2
MLTLVAYDISDQKRLARVARVCEDFGVRVQYSVFECRLDEAEFTEFWLRLLSKIDEDEDRIVAYKIDARSAKETLTADTMVNACQAKDRAVLAAGFLNFPVFAWAQVFKIV